MTLGKTGKRCLVYVVVLSLALCLPVSANKFGNKIDVAGMKEIEAAAAESFPLAITEKKVVEECIDTEDLFEETDVLSFTVENRSGKTVTGYTIKFVAYNDEEITTDISGNLISSSSLYDSPEIFTLDKTGLELADGEKSVVSVPVSFSRFVGVRAMISDYTDDTGTVTKNPDYPNWENLAFGLAAGNVTELD